MAYETKPNTGSLFVNDRKQQVNQPDRTGTINIDGKLYWLSGWLKEANGKKYLSLSVKPKEGDAPPKAAPKPQADEPFEDDPSIPF